MQVKLREQFFGSLHTKDSAKKRYLEAKLSQYFAVQVFPECTELKKGTMIIVNVLETK